MASESPLSIEIARPVLPSTSASIIERVGKGIGALSLNAAIQTIGQIIIVPLALFTWGKLRYGEWILLTGLVSFLRLSDLGLQTFVVNRLCSNYARGEREQMERDLHDTLRFQVPLVLLLTLGFAIVLLIFPVNGVLALQTVSRSAFFVIAILLIAELLLGIPMGVVAGIYRATGRLARGAFIGACQQSLILLFTIALIGLHQGFVGLAAARVGIALIISLCILIDLHSLYPWMHIWSGPGDWRAGARMIGPGLFFIMIPLADYLSNQFTLLVLQRSINAGEVSRLATHRTVVNVGIMASALLTNAVWPELTRLHARSQQEELRKAYRSLARINMWLVGAVCFVLLAFAPLIYPSWTAGKLSIDPWTFGFLMTRMLLWAAWSASMTMLCAINKQRALAGVLLASATLSCLVSIWLVPAIGVSGAALAQLIGDLAISAWLVPLLASREINDDYKNFMGATVGALLKGLLLPIGLGSIGWRLVHSELLRLVILTPVVSSIAIVLMWTQLASYERAYLLNLVKQRFPAYPQENRV